MPESQIQITRPFGPSIAKVQMPDELVKTLNKYVDDIIADDEKSKKQDWGHKLAGHVKQEFVLENKFVETSGFMNFLAKAVGAWILNTEKKKISKFIINETWVVRQFENDYNPIHWHSGHVSGVGYLKVPKILGQESKDGKKTYKNGIIELVHGA